MLEPWAAMLFLLGSVYWAQQGLDLREVQREGEGRLS